MNGRISLLVASLAAAVALGALGAHALRTRLAPDMLAAYQTAVQYSPFFINRPWRPMP